MIICWNVHTLQNHQSNARPVVCYVILSQKNPIQFVVLNHAKFR